MSEEKILKEEVKGVESVEFKEESASQETPQSEERELKKDERAGILTNKSVKVCGIEVKSIDDKEPLVA